MPETPNWTKHFSVLDKFRGKKKPPEAVAHDSSPILDQSASVPDRDTAVLLTEKKERAMQALMGEYTRLKQEAISTRADNKMTDALALLEQAEGFLTQAEHLNSLSPDQLKISELDEVLKQYPLPEKKKSLETITSDTLTATTPDGKEISFNLREQIQYWGDFYRKEGIDWISFPPPETILSAITPDQIKEMTKLMERGFDKLIIIPDNLVGSPTIKDKKLAKPAAHYADLHRLMSQGYTETYQESDYQADGGLAASQDKTSKLRLILTKDIQNLKDDELFKKTIDKSIDDLNADELTQFTGFSESSYLIYQREYFKRTGKHLDEVGWTWLPESDRPLSGRVPDAYWYPDGSQLDFDSDARDDRSGDLGCRLAGSFEIPR